MFADQNQKQYENRERIKREIHSIEDLVEFTTNVVFSRESFFLELRDDFPRASFRGPGQVVWHEGIRSQNELHQFFYDDGDVCEVEFDEHGDVVPGTDEYPFIECKIEDIISVSEI